MCQWQEALASPGLTGILLFAQHYYVARFTFIEGFEINQTVRSPVVAFVVFDRSLRAAFVVLVWTTQYSLSGVVASN